YGSSTDAYHVTDPAPHGASKAMQLAIERAGIQVEDVDYINAHGTSTPAGNISETKAIKEVFGDHAYQLKASSTKSMTGHLFGAAGGIESIITLKSMNENIFPPTINLTHPDPECDLDYVPNKAIEGNIEIALSNGFGFGRHNAVLCFKKWNDSASDFIERRLTMSIKLMQSVEERRKNLENRVPEWPRDTVARHFEKAARTYAEKPFLYISN